MDTLDKDYENEATPLQDVNASDELAERLYAVLVNDDVDGYEKIVVDDPAAANVKLGSFPLLTAAIMLGAEKLEGRLSKEYYGTAKFKELKAPIDLILASAAIFAAYSDMYKDVRFVEPAEIYLLKGDISKFSEFLGKGGIKTLAANKRAEKIASDLKPDYVIIPAKGENLYKFVKVRSKKKTFLTILFVILAIVVIATPTVVMLAIRTKVYFYSDGEEWGHQEGFAGAKINIQEPVKENYNFTGWYIDEECTKASNGKLSKRNSKLYAGWEVIVYEVKFDYVGKDINGADVKTVVGELRSSLNLPVLYQEGKLFLGWYEGDARFSSSIFTRSLTLTPKFKEVSVQDGVYKLSDPDDLLYLDTLNVEKISLEKDVELSKTFLPYGYFGKNADGSYKGFDGEFDGKGHTVSFDNVARPLFTTLNESAKAHDVKLVCGKKNVPYYENNLFGFIALVNDGEIYDIEATLGLADVTDEKGETIDNSLFFYDANSKVEYFGALVGGNNGTVRDCVVKGNLKASSNLPTATLFFASVAGSNTGTVLRCENQASISATGNVAGLVGANSGSVSNSVNKGEIMIYKNARLQSSFLVAGVVAYNAGDIIECENQGIVKSYAANVLLYEGGVAAIMQNGKMESCSNKNAVSVEVNEGGAYVGGILGAASVADGSKIEIVLCENLGEVNGNNRNKTRIAGIAAYAFGKKDADVLSFEKCVNYGAVKNANVAAGLVGYSGYAKITLSRNEGDIYGSGIYNDSIVYAGGLAAQFFFGSIESCANAGDVSMNWEKQGVDLSIINANLKEGQTPFETVEEYEASFENLVGGVAAQFEGSVATNVYQAGEVSGKYGSLGILAGLASTENPDCYFTNCHALSSVENGWYAYLSEVDESGKYINVDENGSIIKKATAAEKEYQTVEDMYSLADVLGEAFVNKENSTPVFAWENE